MSRWMRRFVLVFIFFLLANTDSTAVGPINYPTGINPLTGLPVSDPAALNRRPLLIKVSNFPPYIRPQSGLNSADMVWEHLLAGGVTRFTAVFLSQDADHVGPIRSARLVDFQLTHIYRGLFVYSGMAQGTVDRLNQDGYLLAHSIGTGGCPALCRFRQEGLAEEHTLYADTAALRQLAVTLEKGTDVEAVYGMRFDVVPPAAGTGVRGLHVGYRETLVEWHYDAAAGVWLRTQDGEAHFDSYDGEQIHADNIIVLEADHLEQPVNYDGYWGPPNYALDVDLIGGGRIFLLRDGQYYEGEWRRDQIDQPLGFYDLAGNALALKPGRTFVNLVPRWFGGYELKFLLNDPLRATVNQEGGVNLRVGPSTNYATPDVAYGGDTFQVIGRDEAGEWVQLLLPNEDVLWIATEMIAIDGNLMLMPVPRSTYE